MRLSWASSRWSGEWRPNQLVIRIEPSTWVRVMLPPRVHAYKPGSWGPEAVDALVADHGGWRDPWVAS